MVTSAMSRLVCVVIMLAQSMRGRQSELVAVESELEASQEVVHLIRLDKIRILTPPDRIAIFPRTPFSNGTH
jgi:hypothetical protein